MGFYNFTFVRRSIIVEEIQNGIREICESVPYKIVCSQSSGGEYIYKRVEITKKVLKARHMYQIERFTDKQAFHENIEVENLESSLIELMEHFRQLNSFGLSLEYEVKISKKGKLLINKRNVTGKEITLEKNNKTKKYILEEGMIVPPLIELGVFTTEGKVVNSMYDKFKQINRFVEMVEDVLKNYSGDTLNIIDFGCGKSYLTFILYYYIVEIRKMKTNIIGLDLKSDVINKCNNIAEKFGYEDLHFELGDINGYETTMPVDMVITLHACDTATDYALYNAIKWDAKIILSVPCCQHETNQQIHTDNLGLLTKYGIVKERVAALMTDAIRANALESMGYKTNLLEFIDISHSPKNILIRGVKGNVSQAKRQQAREEIVQITLEFGLEPTLVKLLGL